MATWDGTSVYYSLAVMGQWYSVKDSSTAVISSCRMAGRREIMWRKIEYKTQRLSKMKSKAGIIRLCVHATLLQSCPTLCDPVDCSLPSSSVHGIFQARILKWVSISYSRRSSWPRDQTPISCIFYIGRQILYCCTTRKPPSKGS